MILSSNNIVIPEYCPADKKQHFPILQQEKISTTLGERMAHHVILTSTTDKPVSLSQLLIMVVVVLFDPLRLYKKYHDEINLSHHGKSQIPCKHCLYRSISVILIQDS